ncbi:MAG: aromatic-ring-hydroxylating dioxygenase subunit beta [Rhodospirillales bacterium]|nr:aromatic-ring-hydroxylating dioxygenase subunit beta [Rhodospirillales bacterium]
MTEALPLHHQVSHFLVQEAELLDLGDFDGWLNLFAEDGIYWIPSASDQTDMQGQVSILLEDVPLLKLRVARLSHPRAYAVSPSPATVHLVGNITVETGTDDITVRSKLIVNEVRDDVSSSLSGTATHQLVASGDSFKIRLKRVDLIQAGGTFNALSIPL